jgi:hypothetical protein
MIPKYYSLIIINDYSSIEIIANSLLIYLNIMSSTHLYPINHLCIIIVSISIAIHLIIISIFHLYPFVMISISFTHSLSLLLTSESSFLTYHS